LRQIARFRARMRVAPDHPSNNRDQRRNNRASAPFVRVRSNRIWGEIMKKTCRAVYPTVTCLAGPALAQQPAPAGPPVGPDWSKIEVKTFDLGNRTYMLEGFGGNTTIADAEGGGIMIDAQFAQMHDKLKAAIAAVSQQPVRFLVNTHYHRDHVG